jgi:hypothetical protein
MAKAEIIPNNQVVHSNTLAQYLANKANGLLTRKGLVKADSNPDANPQGSDATHFLLKSRQEQGGFLWCKHLQRMRVESEHHARAPYRIRSCHRLSENRLMPKMHPIKVSQS